MRLQPWDSNSDSSEKLLQRGGKEVICDFGEGRVQAIKSLFFPENFHWSQEALVTRNSRHYEGLQRFSRCEEIQELGL